MWHGGGPTWVREAIKHMLPRGLVTRTLHRCAARSILLTFDDGPDPEVTPAVLERLDAYQARAVFFIVGRRIKRASHLLRQIREKGHLLGNHSYLHRKSYIRCSSWRLQIMAYYRDCRRCQAAIERHAGDRASLFRPPGGRLTCASLLVPKLLGLRCMTWSMDVADWRFRNAAEARAGAEKLLCRIAPRDIVLLHDDNPCVLDLLDILLPGLQALQFDLSSGVTFL